VDEVMGARWRAIFWGGRERSASLAEAVVPGTVWEKRVYSGNDKSAGLVPRERRRARWHRGGR